jgi:hypothetical protein
MSTSLAPLALVEHAVAFDDEVLALAFSPRLEA